jgi:hypothetical protein
MDSSISDDPRAPDGLDYSGPVKREKPATPPAEAEAAEEPTEAPDEASGEDPELAAAHGHWTPAAGFLEAGGGAHPLWDLEGGWVGTRIGDEVTGTHIIAADREALAEKVTTFLAQKK